MDSKQINAMWTSSILLRYVTEKEIRADAAPAFSGKYGLVEFLVDNYELFHLYPDEAVFDEIDKEIAGQTNV